MSEIVDCIAWIVRKTFWTFGVLLKFLGLRLLDLLGLIFNVLACGTVLRLPFMIADFFSMDDMWDWRLRGFIQVCMFFCDIPILIMGLFILITLWRVYPCYVEMKEKWKDGWTPDFSEIHDYGFKIRGVIVKQFFKSCIDIFCVPTSLVLLLSWRSVIFVRAIRKAEKDSERRKCCFIQFFQLLLDIPLILFTIPVVLSWRLPFLVRKLYKNSEDDWDDLRFHGFYQFVYLFVDIPCFIMMFITLFTWRCPILVWQLSKPKYLIFKKRQQWKIRKIISCQFLFIFLDIPVILCLPIVLLTIWRLPTLCRRLSKKIKEQYSKKEFYKKEMKIRLVVLQEFRMVFIDFICFFLFVIVLLSLWRTIPIIKGIKEYLKRYKEGKKDKENREIAPLKPVNAVENPMSDNATTSDAKVEVEEGESSNIEIVDTVNEEDEEDEVDKKPPLSWSKCMWKIRKTICMQFVMLLVDLPAIPLCLFLLITVLRTTRLVSDLLAGNFYMLFAVSVYYHTLHFFIDLLFIILFLILLILRPIQVWINLLEDEDHLKRRELTEITKWMPDIVKDRHQVYARLDDILSISFKRGLDVHRCRIKLEAEFEEHIDRIEEILRKLEKHEIEDEYVYLVKSVLFLENHRIGKMLRYYQTENNYLISAKTEIRNQNLKKLQRETFEYNRKISSFYEKITNYRAAKVPLYACKSGLSIRTRDETKKVLLKTLPKGGLPVLIGVLLCCLPLYRAPKMIYRLFKRWYSRFEILKETLYEYALDFLTIVRILFVIICMYRAPFMLVDIFDCIIEKRSWTAVRKVVKRYPGFIIDDLIMLFKALLSWKSIRFVLTAILFGFLIPADLFLTVSKSFTKSKCIGYMLTLFLYAIFMGFPFVFSFYGAEKILSYGLSWVNMVVISVFIVLLLIVLFLMVISLIRDEKKTFLLKMPDADYIRYNWYNAHVILFEILEFFQSLALIFKLTNIPMYGGDVLADASKHLLFSFLPFKPIFWITVAAFIVWFFTCGAPIMLENILETFPVGTCGKRPSWRLGISLLANTLFLFFVENFVSFTACSYEKCPSDFTLGQIPSNATCLKATFIEDNSIQCWSNTHRSYAVFGLIGLVWYCTTALIFDTTYGDPETMDQDIGFSPIYNTVINIFKAAMVVCVTVVTDSPYATLVCLLVLNILSVGFTFVFKMMFKFYPCNIPSVLVWRLCTFVSSCVVVIAVLIAYALDDPSSKTPLIVMGVGILITFIISFAIAIKLRRISDVEREREQFRQEIQQLEKRIFNNKWFLKGWEDRKNTWYRLVKSVRSAQKQDKMLNPKQDPEEITSYNTFDPPPPIIIKPSPPIVHVDKDQDKSNDVPLYMDDPPNSAIEPANDWENTSLSIDGPSSPIQEAPSTSQPPIQPPPLTDIDLPPPPPYEAVEKNKNTYYNIRDIQTDDDEILRLEKNGRNLLLILEKYIDYKAYRYVFFKQRDLWLNSAWNANWSSLLQCLRVLNKNTSGDFDRPSTMDVDLAPDISIDEHILGDDPQDQEEPPKEYIRETPEMKEARSLECRNQALSDIESFPNYSEELKALFERLLPKIPVIKSWDYEMLISGRANFTLKCSRVSTGKITGIEEENGGNKLAIGASLTIGKTLSGTIRDGGITLNEKIQGKKGPVSMNVDEVLFLVKKKKVYISVSGKKAPLSLALASSTAMEWS